ncbi:MAG: hypothetical protein COV69_00815 [Parcubacteria group bacterium CG11_big_fil_rev_8_21_14_0_20_39_14]|nr:MAG: hypothetical protein COV69_00815 [Parcubacteria group bacterium CG11_big_fil_rev_8_21_14_0_20_39_14]PIS35743.1 MAG: hypothetical protein COT36_00750 [Parcubacteria group bacterium CG08_land_8_20_14_0_20_38_56]
MKYGDYLYSLRFFLLFAFLLFVFSAFLGYLSAQEQPEKAQFLLEEMRQAYGPMLKTSALWQFVFVFLNNSFTLFLVLSLGIIFGIFPGMVLFSNGAILGMLAFLLKDNLLWPGFFTGILPHGIIEIPVMILACAVGLKIGKTAYKKVFKKPGELKTEILIAFKFFLKVLLPLLALAAAIEIFLTAKLLSL